MRGPGAARRHSFLRRPDAVMYGNSIDVVFTTDFGEWRKSPSTRFREVIEMGQLCWRAWSPLWGSASSGLSSCGRTVVKQLEPGALWRGVWPCVGVSPRGRP
jgi:hypothetical protein